MRPEALELEGFTAFRKPTRVEFGDAELFALTGSTGAGKSSLIDAMIFALYGSVPRLDGGQVEPIISKGRQEARVRLDFVLGGKHYTAVRVVKRTANGAKTTEARLESGEAVPAANARELKEQVRKLIGLSFKQFTTCVALPQGEFARFLKQQPGKRQQLLSQLLGLGIYAQVRRKAGAVEDKAKTRLELLTERLDALADVNKAAVKARKKRLAAAKELQTLADECLPELAKLGKDLVEAKAQRGKIDAQALALASIATPDVVKDLAKATTTAEKYEAQAQQALNQADREAEEAKKHLDSLGDIVVLNAAQAKHQDRNQLGEAIKQAKEKAREAGKKSQAAGG